MRNRKEIMALDMSFWGTDICQACLCKNRRIYPLRKLQSILKEIDFLQVINTTGGVCWECRRIIMKMQNFKNQVIDAQNILCRNLELKYLGSLSTINKNEFDYKFIYDLDPLVHNENGTKNELFNVKDEQKNTVDEKCDLESGTCLDYIPCIEDIKLDTDGEEIKFGKEILKTEDDVERDTKRVLKMIKGNFRKLKSKDIEDDELRDKFTTVIFSEDEMLRNREEKRSQPNFRKIPYKCNSCVLGFTRKETYDFHCEKKHNKSIGPYSCPVCRTRFASARSMKSHKQRHYTCYRCRLCKYETLQRGSALAHCGAKHAGDRAGCIHCGQCEFVASTPEDLAEHKRSVHILHCNECGEKFKGKHTLRTHKLRIHKSNRDYICDICSKSFKTKSRLESHMATHNATLAQQLSYCNVCNVQYKNIYVYRNHLKNSANHSERLYQCQDCNKRFASKVYWRKHRDFYHLKKSQFKCDVCNKLLISEWRLKNHMQTRHGSSRSRNHACDDCGKKFFTVSTLRAHQLTHSTLRSYMCEWCGDTFKQRAALHTHKRALHTHARPS